MNKAEKKKAAVEWSEILKNHPSFARVFLAQQAILMEASELGIKLVDRSMCQLLRAGLPVLFEGFWVRRCKEEIRYVQSDGVIGCLTRGNRDPARCFSSDDPEAWFDDPLAGGRTLPPKPPVPPI
jgi:hypothetical protein